MDQKIIDKVIELLRRTIELNEKAPEGVSYTFDFSGTVHAVTFGKWRKEEECFTIHEYAYLKKLADIRPLSAIEEIIANEEKKQEEENNETV